MHRASVALVMLSVAVLLAAGIGSAAAAAPSCTIDGSAGGELSSGRRAGT
jgi:hypothetical protein